MASKRCQSWKTMTLSRDYASMAPRQSSLMHYRPQVADGRLLASLGPHSPIRWMRLIIPDGCHGCVICLCVCFVLSRHSSSSALLLQHGQYTLTMPLHLCMDISIVKCIYFPCCSSSCLPMPCGGVCARACSLTSSSLLKLVCAIHTAFNTYLPDPNHMYIQGCPIGTGS